MIKQEIMNRLVRLNNIMHEAGDIISELEGHINGRILADCTDISIHDLMEGTWSKQARFTNATRAKGVNTLRDLLLYTQNEVLKWRGVGEGCVKEAAERIKAKFGIVWE